MGDLLVRRQGLGPDATVAQDGLGKTDQEGAFLVGERDSA